MFDSLSEPLVQIDILENETPYTMLESVECREESLDLAWCSTQAVSLIYPDVDKHKKRNPSAK